MLVWKSFSRLKKNNLRNKKAAFKPTCARAQAFASFSITRFIQRYIRYLCILFRTTTSSARKHNTIQCNVRVQYNPFSWFTSHALFFPFAVYMKHGSTVAAAAVVFFFQLCVINGNITLKTYCKWMYVVVCVCVTAASWYADVLIIRITLTLGIWNETAEMNLFSRKWCRAEQQQQQKQWKYECVEYSKPLELEHI